jgi:hypothetical protein
MLSNSKIQANKRAANTLGALGKATVSKALPDVSALPLDVAGGTVRTLASAVATEVGNASAQLAVVNYKEMTDDALRALQSQFSTVDPAFKSVGEELLARFLDDARSYAGRSFDELSAMLDLDPKNNALRTARMWAKNGYDGYNPVKANVRKTVAKKIEGVVGRTMQNIAKGDFPQAEKALTDGVERMILDSYRETIGLNAEQDGFVTGYQRVPSPNACAFCAVVALNEYTSFEDDGGYHDNCGCTTVPVYRGVDSYRPDYFDKFEAEYETASQDVGPIATAEDILAAVRANTGRN